VSILSWCNTHPYIWWTLCSCMPSSLAIILIVILQWVQTVTAFLQCFYGFSLLSGDQSKIIMDSFSFFWKSCHLKSHPLILQTHHKLLLIICKFT
jgi:hypothetical protein